MWDGEISVSPLSLPVTTLLHDTLVDPDPSLSPQVITPEMKEFMLRVKEKAVVGIVGGSDFVKMEEQMGGEGSK